MLALDAGKGKRNARKRRQLERKNFQRAHRAEKFFARQLRQVAAQVGSLVNALAPDGIVANVPGLTIALERYAELLRPWAQAVSARSVAEVAQRDERSWSELGRTIGRNLGEEIRKAPTGEVMRAQIEERVKLITSLPREAARRVHKLVIEGMEDSTRAAETAHEIARSGKVTKSRAMLIARTETTSAATALIEARAKFIGSTHYVWETAGDADVRELHKHMQGQVIAWNDPPQMEPRLGRYHAGAGPNCRCWPRPILPTVID